MPVGFQSSRRRPRASKAKTGATTSGLTTHSIGRSRKKLAKRGMPFPVVPKYL